MFIHLLEIKIHEKSSSSEVVLQLVTYIDMYNHQPAILRLKSRKSFLQCVPWITTMPEYAHRACEVLLSWSNSG